MNLRSRRTLRFLVLLAAALIYAVVEWQAGAGFSSTGSSSTGSSSTGKAGGPNDDPVGAAWSAQASGVWVETSGRVDRVLSDDLRGSRHQRFILELESGQTVLVAHNIDLAPKVPLSVGDRVELYGEYEWNDRGGVIHWTHHDPQGRRKGGWILHQGERYD